MEMGLGSRQAGADHAHHSVVLHQRRRAGGSKKQSGKSLGAVKLKAGGATQHSSSCHGGSDTAHEQENVDPQPCATPEFVKPGQDSLDDSLSSETSATARFQDELARTCTAEKWFDEQLTECQRESRRRSTGSSGADSSRPSSTQSRLATQLRSFQEALKQHLSDALNGDDQRLSHGSGDAIYWDLDSSPAFRDTDADAQGSSILDLGINAISKVGQTLNNFADKVDTTIEQWLEGFQSIEDLQNFLDAPGHQQGRSPSLSPPSLEGKDNHNQEPQATSIRSLPAASSPPRHQQHDHQNQQHQHHQQKPSAANSRNQRGARRQSHETRSSAEEAELREAMARKEDEHRRMQEECRRLHAELSYAANKCSALSEENSLLRMHLESDEAEAEGAPSPQQPTPSNSPRRNNGHNPQQQQRPRGGGPGDPDPITDLMAKQLEALLTEKSKLAQENARLERENNNLHDILTYSLAAQDEEDEDAEVDDERLPGPWVSEKAVSGGNQGSAAALAVM